MPVGNWAHWLPVGEWASWLPLGEWAPWFPKRIPPEHKIVPPEHPISPAACSVVPVCASAECQDGIAAKHPTLHVFVHGDALVDVDVAAAVVPVVAEHVVVQVTFATLRMHVAEVEAHVRLVWGGRGGPVGEAEETQASCARGVVLVAGSKSAATNSRSLSCSLALKLSSTSSASWSASLPIAATHRLGSP